jgi:hypothetical protein
MNAIEEKSKRLLEYETFSIAHRNFTSAGIFFKNVTIPSGREPTISRLDFQLRMRPIIELPFTTGPKNDYIYEHKPEETELISSKDQMKKYQYSVTDGKKLKINEDLRDSLQTQDLFDRPLVFLVHSYFQRRDTPHTGIYILYEGKLYTIGYGYSIFSEHYPQGRYVPEEQIEKRGTFYSPDLQLDPNNPSVILWVGLLTSEILDRLERDIEDVKYIRFFTNSVKREEDGLEVNVVQNNSKYYITLINNRIYDLYAYEHDLGIDEKDKTEWNCHKWALYILFGSIDAIIGGVTDDMVIEFNRSVTTGYEGISAVYSDDEQDRQYETDPFDPNLMSYGIRPSNLYMLYEAMAKSDRVSYITALKQIDHDFKIRWKIRMDKQQEEEELARQGGMNMKRKRKRNLRKTKKLRKMNKCKSKKVIVKRRNTHNCCRSVKRNKRK